MFATRLIDYYDVNFAQLRYVRRSPLSYVIRYRRSMRQSTSAMIDRGVISLSRNDLVRTSLRADTDGTREKISRVSQCEKDSDAKEGKEKQEKRKKQNVDLRDRLRSSRIDRNRSHEGVEEREPLRSSFGTMRARPRHAKGEEPSRFVTPSLNHSSSFKSLAVAD